MWVGQEMEDHVHGHSNRMWSPNVYGLHIIRSECRITHRSGLGFQYHVLPNSENNTSLVVVRSPYFSPIFSPREVGNKLFRCQINACYSPSETKRNPVFCRHGRRRDHAWGAYGAPKGPNPTERCCSPTAAPGQHTRVPETWDPPWDVRNLR